MRRKIGRRKFLKTGTAAAVVAVVGGVGGFLAYQAARPTSAPTQPVAPATPSPSPTPAAYAPTPAVAGANAEERALNAAIALAKTLPSEARLRVLMMAGGLQQWKPFTDRWTEATGIPVEFDEMAIQLTVAKISEEATTKAGKWDVLTGVQDYFGDGNKAGVIREIEDFASKYGPELRDQSNCPPVPQSFYSTSVRGKLVGFPICGDQLNLFLRTDLLLDPSLPEPYEKQFGYLLPVNGPDTWVQLRDMVQFVDEQFKDRGVRGGWFFRNVSVSSPQEFFIRFYQKGGVVFDDNMNAQLNTRFAREAAEEMKELLPFMDPIVLTAGSFEEHFADYAAGKAFATLSWPTMGPVYKAARGDTAGAFRIPGTIVNGKLVRATVISLALGAAVNAHSKNPELAYLLLQWLHSPNISLQWLQIVGLFIGAWRECHFTTILGSELPNAQPVFRQNMIDSVPILGLASTFELYNAIGTNLYAFFTGAKDVDTAISDMNDAWNGITETVGKEEQRQNWEALKRVMPKDIKKLHGWT